MDTENARYLPYVSWPYPRFVKPYCYYHTHQKNVEWEEETTPATSIDSTTQIEVDAAGQAADGTLLWNK